MSVNGEESCWEVESSEINNLVTTREGVIKTIVYNTKLWVFYIRKVLGRRVKVWRRRGY